jgi:hypothetical protein
VSESSSRDPPPGEELRPWVHGLLVLPTARATIGQGLPSGRTDADRGARATTAGWGHTACHCDARYLPPPG